MCSKTLNLNMVEVKIVSLLCFFHPSAWAVMMDRRQQRLLLVLLPPVLFVPSHQDEAEHKTSLEALGDDTQPFIIYEETSDIWVNVRGNALIEMFFVVVVVFLSVLAIIFVCVVQVHDIFHPFIQTRDDEITFITVNESKTGFCHLYKITTVLQRRRYNWAKGYTHSEGNVHKMLP